MEIVINSQQIEQLDLSPIEKVIELILETDEKLNFQINYPRDPQDPREISEVPEVRLYFVRLDARYPWLPLFLDWKSGALALYTAMLVPHQFNRNEGIIYNPEALEIFVMHKIFLLTDWLKSKNLPYTSRVKLMAQTLGYDLEDAFFSSQLE